MMMYHDDIMTKVALEDRSPDLQSDGERLVRAMQEDSVVDETHERSDRQTVR